MVPGWRVLLAVGAVSGVSALLASVLGALLPRVSLRRALASFLVFPRVPASARPLVAPVRPGGRVPTPVPVIAVSVAPGRISVAFVAPLRGPGGSLLLLRVVQQIFEVFLVLFQASLLILGDVSQSFHAHCSLIRGCLALAGGVELQIVVELALLLI